MKIKEQSGLRAVLEGTPIPRMALVRQIFEEDAVNGLVHGVEQNRHVVAEQVGVVRYAGGDGVDALKHGQAPVVAAHPYQIGGDLLGAVHGITSILLFSFRLQSTLYGAEKQGVSHGLR